MFLIIFFSIHLAKKDKYTYMALENDHQKVIGQTNDFKILVAEKPTFDRKNYKVRVLTENSNFVFKFGKRQLCYSKKLNIHTCKKQKTKGTWQLVQEGVSYYLRQNEKCAALINPIKSDTDSSELRLMPCDSENVIKINFIDSNNQIVEIETNYTMKKTIPVDETTIDESPKIVTLSNQNPEIISTYREQKFKRSENSDDSSDVFVKKKSPKKVKRVDSLTEKPSKDHDIKLVMPQTPVITKSINLNPEITPKESNKETIVSFKPQNQVIFEPGKEIVTKPTNEVISEPKEKVVFQTKNKYEVQPVKEVIVGDKKEKSSDNKQIIVTQNKVSGKNSFEKTNNLASDQRKLGDNEVIVSKKMNIIQANPETTDEIDFKKKSDPNYDELLFKTEQFKQNINDDLILLTTTTHNHPTRQILQIKGG